VNLKDFSPQINSLISVADPDPFDTDPDPDFHFSTDQDPAFRPEMDPDPYPCSFK
jgi:hypothetical protein